MKRLIPLTGSFVLILVTVFCTMGALISAFSFTVEISALFLPWLITALALSALAAVLRGKGILILALPALALFSWRMPEILSGAKWVIFFITSEYNKWIDIPVLFAGSIPDTYAVSLFFSAAGIFLAFLLSFAISLRHSTVLTVLFTAPLVSLTFVLTTFQPFRWYLIELLAVYLTLLVSSSLYPDDYHKRRLAVFPALILAITLLSVSYFLTSAVKDRRGELISFIDSHIRAIASQTGFARMNLGVGWPEGYSDNWVFYTDNVKVSDAGPRVIEDRGVLEITTTQAGSFYLKGYSMQLFDGRAWNTGTDARWGSEERLTQALTLLLASLYSNLNPDMALSDISMTVAGTGDHSGLIYLPYYTYDYSNDYLPNSVRFFHSSKSFTEIYRALPRETVEEGISGLIPAILQTSARIKSTYTKIDNSTAEGLLQLAADAGIDPDADRAVIADSVAAYISASARYTLTPTPIPAGEDFALYFLQTSKQGYCIHFATAAVLMLRALDVPARFATGFAVTVPGDRVGDPVVVTDRQAHAWVEVYYDSIGWIPLEATPAGVGIPARIPHAPSAGTGLDNYSPDDFINDEPRDNYPERTSQPEGGPDASQGTQEQPAPTGTGVYFLIAVSCIAALALLLYLRQVIARKYREKLFSQEDTNAAVIYIWRYASRLNRRKPLPEDIEGLALKARFSQHRMSESERAAMLVYASNLSAGLYKKYYLPGRLWLKYIRLY